MDAHPPPVLALWSNRPGESVGDMPDEPTRLEGIADSPGQALENARTLFPGRDVLLCAAIAQWPPSGWERLRSAWQQNPNANVLSPLSAEDISDDGRGTVDMDASCWSLGEHASFAADFFSSQCSLWRADALRALPASIPPQPPCPPYAYFLPSVWIGPPNDGRRRDDGPLALRSLRKKLERHRNPRMMIRYEPERPVLLHILHSWGGGIDRFARDLAAADGARRHLLLVADNEAQLPPFGDCLRLHADLNQAPLRRWPLAEPIADSVDTSLEVIDVLRDIIADWGVGAVLVSSLIGHSFDALRTGLPTAFCVHDAYPFWPLLHSLPTTPVDAVTDPDLADRIEQSGPQFILPHRQPAFWRSLRRRLLDTLDRSDSLMVAPSNSARQRLCDLVPELSARRWRVIGHGIDAEAPPPDWRARLERPLRVLVPGHLHGHKGEKLLTGLSQRLPTGVELILLGSGKAAESFHGKSGVHIHPHYRHEELASWVERLRPDIALLPSTVPETWSYVLSEMIALGVPSLCPRLGALEERIAAGGFGWLVEPNADAVAECLTALAADRTLIAAMRRRPRPTLPSLANMAEQWRDALVAKPGSPRLSPATASDLTRLAAEFRQAESLESLQQQARQLARLSQEIHEQTARAANAESESSSLRTELAAACKEKTNAQAEQASLMRRAAGLEDELRQSQRLREKESADLSQQRDDAIGERDRYANTLKQIAESRSWRLTLPLRLVAYHSRNLIQSMAYRLTQGHWLFQRGMVSLKTRGWVGTSERMRQRFGLGRKGPDMLFDPLRFEQTAVEPARLDLRPRAEPRASIVVPVFNQLQHTLRCLRSLMDSGDATPFEVIVVDDSSTDGTAETMTEVLGLRYRRNPENTGFIGACNAGAQLARSEFLVFLNNDARAQPGWLDALLATFDSHPDTGLAGSKLVYPDGRLQEAGGIIFADGSCWNVGRFEDPAHPRYNFLREADYCSGAAIALPRALFERLGGFDTEYSPAYYEDTDLAMRVRQQGLKVRYQPASTVVHFEGISSGTDALTGIKAHQAHNQKKFFARWQPSLAATHPGPGSDLTCAAEHRARSRVLVVDAFTPKPDRDSGSARLVELMALLLEEGCTVSFLPENLAHEGRYTEALQRLGVQPWWRPWIGSIPRWLAENGHRFDAVIVSRHYVLAPLLPLLRKYAPQARIVFDTVDLHFLREQREAEHAGDSARKRAADRTREAEARLAAKADITWVVSPIERSLLADAAPGARVEVVSNIHRVVTDTPGYADRQGLIFVGNYRHPPNVDAAHWLAEEIFPRIRSARPDIELHLVGGEAPTSVRVLSRKEGVRFHDHVAELESLLDRMRISLAPLRYGAGVKGKVNQSLARGLPTVATSCAVEGMHLQEGEDVLIADAPEDFAKAVLRLYDDAALWQRLRDGGLENTRRYFSREAAREGLRSLLGNP